MDTSKRRFTIGKKMYIFVIGTVLFATVGVGALSYAINSSQIDRYFKRLTINSARNFATFVDVDFLQELRDVAESDEYQELRDKAEETDDESIIEAYLTEKGLWDRYVQQREQLTKYLKNMNDIKYLYIVVWGDADAKYDMYLLDDDENPNYETGYFEVREPEFRGVDPSGEVEPVINNGDWGWLCSGFAPVYDSEGNIVCHVGCDVGMEDIMRERRINLIYVMISVFVLVIIILAIAFVFVNKWVVNPLNLITSEMKKFSPAADKDYKEAGVVELDINSRDEIEDIYQEIRSMQINIIDYIDDIIAIKKDKEKAEDDIRNKDKVIGKITKDAYKDSLTGVGTKAAYAKRVDELNVMISEGVAEFAIVMVDINLLKMINDNYGHSAGDKYIRGCSHVICEVFKHSPVFRVGGDEFVAILTDDDYDKRHEKMKDIRSIFEESYANKEVEEWQRYSAATGMAEYEPGTDTVENVFMRADKSMYNEKMEFKKRHNISVDARI